MTGVSGSILPALSTSSLASNCRGHCHASRYSDDVVSGDSQSISTRSSATSIASTISGSGLLFLKNYLSKKKLQKAAGGRQSSETGKHMPRHMTFFNSTPMPFPPPRDHYGPVFVKENDEDEGGRRDGDGEESSSSTSQSSRRQSLCSTVADLLNEDFDCDDSELKNLDWEEWDEPLPEDLSYDDLVSVISESLYSDELDLAELCDLDMEGRKTVVASEVEEINNEDRGMRSCSNPTRLHSLSPENDTPSCSSPPGINLEGSVEKISLSNKEESSTQESMQRRPAIEPVRNLDLDLPAEVGRSRYSSYRSNSTFLQTLEAELELPPMSPVSDEKDEAVRAISRTISRYMRTRSDGSCSTDAGTTSSAVAQTVTRQQQLPYSRTNSNSSSCGDGRTSSRQSMYVRRLGQQNSRNCGRNSTYDAGACCPRTAYENYGRESRLSVASSLSDCMPEIAASPASPATFRRPLSQLLICDLSSSSPGFISPEQNSQLDDGLLLPLSASSSRGDSSRGLSPGLARSPQNSSSSLTPQQISEILSLPSFDCQPFCSSPSPGRSSEAAPYSSGHLEIWPRGRGDSISSTSKAAHAKNANRDSLLCSGSGTFSFTPPQSGSPLLGSGSGGNNALAFPLMRHSSCNSTDSGCPLIEDKNGSPSPPPQMPLASPRMSRIEVLSSNRHKLASFWEKSLNSSHNNILTADGGGGNGSSAWNTTVGASNNGRSQQLASRPVNYAQHHGFQPPPVRAGVYGSDTSLGSGGSSSERLAHFLDVTRRAAEKRIKKTAEGGRSYMHHRASTGSDCCDFVPPRSGPWSPERRRDSYTEYY
jgi:hypothetical protein